jgi:hypothetical protein
MQNFRALAAAAAAVLALAACADRGDPVAVAPPPSSATPPAVLASMECRADVRAKTVSCDRAALPQAVRGYVVVGGQNQYVKLTAGNITYDGSQNFEFDATVQNLIAQTMGTIDGVAPDSNGVRIFFVLEPTATSGSGMVTVGNADGTATFTAAGQQFYQYADTLLGADHLLASNETSLAKHWIFQMPPTVGTFAFKVYVAAEVRFPNGWVELTGGAFANQGTTDSVTAVVRKFSGDLAADQTVTWGTSNTGVATVDGTGNVTGVGVGSATITATAAGLPGAAAGELAVDICPNLAVGGVYTASMPGAANVCLAGGTSGNAEYTYMPVNISTSSALSLTVTASSVAAVTGPPTPNLIPAGGGLLSLSGTISTAPSIELAALQRDAARLSSMVRGGTRIAASRSLRGGSARASITPGVPAIGDLMELNTAAGCSGTPTLRTGQVRSVSQHLIVVSDTANPAGGFTTAQYDSIALEFDSIGWQVNAANFGTPADADGNGRVIAFFTRAVNELQPPASAQPSDFGYVEKRDLFSNDPVNGCERSNMGEMVYVEVPDPTGAVNSNVRTVSQVRGNATRTLGRELQHLISASRRLAAGNPFEEAWLDMALSDVAQELMFYRTAPGLAPRQNIVLGSLNTGPSASRRVAAFNTYANPMFGEFRGFLQRPDTVGAFRTNNPNSPGFRGAAWAFLRYASDRVNGSEPAFWASMIDTPLTGKANVQAAIGGADPNEWLGDFVAAAYADDNAFSVAAPYQTPSWNYRSVFGGLGGFPLLTRPLTSSTPLTLSYSFGGGTAYFRFGVTQGSFTTVTALSGGVAPTSPYTLRIVRTK